MSNLKNWFAINKLSLNVAKTNFMVFSNRTVPNDIEVTINNYKIDQVYTTKFLGVVIDDKLNWKVRDDTLVSVRSFLRGYLKLTFSMHDHAVCTLASDWLPLPSLARKFEPFFHLQLTLGRGNSSRTILFYFVFLLHVLWVVVFSVILFHLSLTTFGIWRRKSIIYVLKKLILRYLLICIWRMITNL